MKCNETLNEKYCASIIFLWKERNFWDKLIGVR